jgi:precorrin-2/cobalt-factor-2 C20-methyltransferase
MKLGRNLPKVRRALEQAGRSAAAWLVERGTMPGEKIMKLSDAAEIDLPYFSILLVHGQGRRPERQEEGRRPERQDG